MNMDKIITDLLETRCKFLILHIKAKVNPFLFLITREIKKFAFIFVSSKT